MGTISTTIIDNEGKADLSFHGIPLNSLKKATFLVKKTAVLHQLLKMVINGVTYDLEKTALNGAVLFADNFARWDFVAPDGRIDFTGWDTMTIKESFDYMETVLTADPVPAWDTFIGWLNELTSNEDGPDLPNISSSYLKTVDESYSTQVDFIDFTGLTNMVTFLEKLEAYIEPAWEASASLLKTSDTSVGFKLVLNELNDEGVEQVAVTMTFIFRQ